MIQNLTDSAALLYYFAYGSNMATSRLRARVPSAQFYAAAELNGHRLTFHKAGRDGSGKCDILEDAAQNSKVYGVIFTLAPADRPALDRAEGLGSHYREKTVTLRCLQSGRLIEAFTYAALQIDPARPPYDWYKDYVLHGAREHNLPPAYIRAIENIAAIADPDPPRAAHNRAMLQRQGPQN